ncbi:hypothetical protein EWM64_g5263 [Hericium alpestre]|uniref:BTB domain-containing protein n=1 Tax=Hericium alpestre TaxID=135208 RepID=A0A4Y9ZVC6_9AGAM|nr:hypothetical protein EWM64_g5263 [Hericium alpestre]
MLYSNLLLQRMDTDTTLTDFEGYRAFDLYNTTVEGTKPPRESSTGRTELYTWGANRNAALGVGDADDRAHAEHVSLKRSDRGVSPNVMESLSFRLQPASVRSVSMSKLHTVVVTNEPRGNVRTCGFASAGRLGPVKGQHTQYALLPIQQLDQTIVSVATGQDHTLALTDTGVIYSWGLNRFSQLGYTVEVTVGTRVDEPIQSTPRAITGPLKKEIVLGVAACKTASACWTETSVYTWGKNSGQLGYDKAAQPIQFVPRLVTRVNKPVTMLSMTDTAMACLLITKDVILLYNDGHIRINFPAQGFPSEIQAYRPPQAINNASIAKVVSLDNLFAAISSNGEIFTFSPPVDGEAGLGKDKGVIKPQRVWALRKQWSAVRDAALGSDGSLIVCTESGHVFVRTRNPRGQSAILKSSAGAKSFKFQRMPYIQRAVGVLANDTGAMAALRMEFRPQPVQITGNSLAQDLLAIRPWMKYRRVGAEDGKRVEPSVQLPAPESASPAPLLPTDEENDSAEDAAIESDVQAVLGLWEILVQDKLSRQRYGGRGLFERGDALAHGADLLVRVQSGAEFPVHRAILAARCPALAELLSGRKGLLDRDSNMSVKLRLPAGSSTDLPRLVISSGHSLAVLILLHYLYSDQLLAIWDNRVVRRVQAPLALGGLQPAQIVRDLQGLARVLGLSHLDDVLRSATKRVPQPTLVRDMITLFHESQSATSAASDFGPDVVLQLADREVLTHSVVLRARTTFFASFFDMEEWTEERWSEDGTITLNLAHLRWREMEYVLRFMCCGEEGEMFEKLESIESVDGLLDFMFDVMSAANELLLDQLLLICSDILLKYVNLNNVCSVLADAAYLHCLPLVESLHRYLAVNIEPLLESRLLDDLTPRLIKDLSRDVQLLQLEKSPVSRSERLVREAMSKNEAWLAEQDIPHPIIPRTANKGSPRLSPKMSRRPSIPSSPLTSPTVRPNSSSRASQLTMSGDDLFVMDDVPALNLDTAGGDAGASDSVLRGSPWRKTTSAPKVDMKSILAEAEGSKLAASSAASVSKQPSRDRNVTTPVQHPSGSPGISRQGSSGPWRSQVAVSVVATASPARWTEFPVAGAPFAPATPRVKPVQPSPPLGRQSASISVPPPPPHPGLGPVITPSKQSPAKNGTPSTRGVASSGSAWTLPPVQPVVQPSGPTPSFAAIQYAQEQQDSASTKDVRSLKEIQAEEQSRREEEAFLKWWAAEEERIRLEESGVAAVPAKPQRPKKTKSDSRPKAKSAAKEKAPNAPVDGQNGTRKPRPSRNRKASSNPSANSNTL